jgi:hypothetical protein
LAPEDVLIPLKAIDPEVLVMALVAPTFLISIPRPLPVPEAVPVRKIFPFPVVVERGVVPVELLITIPAQLPLLVPLVPFNIMLPPPVVDMRALSVI